METALEQILTSSGSTKENMIFYLYSHPEDFNEAIMLAVSDTQPYAWRAAWLLWSCMEENDHRIKRYLKKIINTIKTKSDGHQRELLKILLQMELNEEYEGILFNLCSQIWEKINKNPSVRMTAFKILIKTAKKHPDLSREILFLTRDQYLDSLSPAVRKAIYKLKKGID
jgi:hypothetical protein